jgi:hypothetical protein
MKLVQGIKEIVNRLDAEIYAGAAGVDACGPTTMAPLYFLLDLHAQHPPGLLHLLKEVRYLPPRPPSHAPPLRRSSATFSSLKLSSQPV